MVLYGRMGAHGVVEIFLEQVLHAQIWRDVGSRNPVRVLLINLVSLK